MTNQTGAAPRFTRGASRHDGEPCIGFDVAQLAAAPISMSPQSSPPITTRA
jgi:hypothetical protein